MGTLKFTNDGIEGETQDIIDFMHESHLTPSTFFSTNPQNQVKWYYFATEIIIYIVSVIAILFIKDSGMKLSLAIISLMDTFIASVHLQRHYGSKFYFYICAGAGIIILAVAFGYLELAKLSDIAVSAAEGHLSPKQ